MLNKIFTTSKNQNYETPPDFFKKLDSVFHFDLDFLANPENAKCELYFCNDIFSDVKEEGWKSVWSNPPYCEILKWMKRIKSMLEDDFKKAWVSVLTFAKTDTRWFQDYGFQAEYALFVRGRLKFEIDGVAGNPAPAPSVVLFFIGVYSEEFPEEEVEALGLGRLVKF